MQDFLHAYILSARSSMSLESRDDRMSKKITLVLSHKKLFATGALQGDAGSGGRLSSAITATGGVVQGYECITWVGVICELFAPFFCPD